MRSGPEEYGSFSDLFLAKARQFQFVEPRAQVFRRRKVKLTVQKRIRKPVSETAAGAWATLNELLQNPLTTREIWLVLGNMLSAKIAVLLRCRARGTTLGRWCGPWRIRWLCHRSRSRHSFP